MHENADKPRVRFSLRWKITLPFILLALLLALGATIAISRLSVQAEQLRFLRQLQDSGQQATDEIVRIEARLLELERAIANTEGVAGAVALGDAEALRERILGLIINAQVDVAVILARDGSSLLASRWMAGEVPEILRGEGYYREWPFVQEVLQLSPATSTVDGAATVKQAGLQVIRLGDEEVYVFFVAGPLVNENGTILGAVLVGEYLDEVVEAISQDARAAISIYEESTGQVISTTFDFAETWNPPGLSLTEDLIESAFAPQAESDPYRTIQIADQTYGEVLTPFVVRQGSVELGLVGIALLGAEDPDLAYQAYQQRVLSVIRVGAAGLLLVVLVGLLISHSITRPLINIADASAQVASGDLDTQVSERGSDEISLLAQTFNRMVEELREGAMYRSMLSRSMSPQMRDQIRASMQKGDSLVGGQSARGSVLFTELRGLSALENLQDPDELMQSIHVYFDGFVGIIQQHGGVLHKFDGKSFTAMFGILPRPLPPQVSALQATHAGLELLDFVAQLNNDRAAEGAPGLELGIGISTGTVVTGGLATEDQMHYTVLGDAVRVAETIERITQEPSSANLIISVETYRYLENVQSQFEFGRQGRAQIGAGRQIEVYEVIGRTARLVGDSP